MKGEGRPLGIQALRHEVAAGNFHRAAQDLAAELFDLLDRPLHVLHHDVVEPGGNGHLGGLREDPTERDIAALSRVHLVDAHFAHVNGFGFFPPEELLVEREGRRRIARRQLVPREVPRLRRTAGSGLDGGKGGEDRPLGIRQDSESAHGRDIRSRYHDPSPELCRLSQRFVHARHQNIGNPVGRCAGLSSVFGERHDPSEGRFPVGPHGVRLVHAVPDRRSPADELGIERLRSVNIVRHEVVPIKASAVIHGRLLSRSSSRSCRDAPGFARRTFKHPYDERALPGSTLRWP